MRKLNTVVAASLLGIGASGAFALDTPDGGFIVYKVGGSADCPYHTIQDAVDAAAQHPGVDLVWIAMDQSYDGQHVVITDQDLNIQGGFSDCEDIDPALDQTVISGTSGHSVFEIEGNSNVYMTNMQITGANLDGDHRGGGIYFGGSGSLDLYAVWVHDNQAAYGGGIDMNPSGPAVLTLQATTVSSNTALIAGGGVRVEGQTVFNTPHAAGEYNIYITHNHALGEGGIGYGGGVEVLGPAVAYISADVELNDAPYGGGIAALATGQGSAFVNVFTTDADSPVLVNSNSAGNTGGGIFLKPYADGATTAKLCAQDFEVDDNSALNGSALYADEDNQQGSIAFINSDGGCDAPPGAVRCAPGVTCNEISDNFTEVNSGSTVLIQSGGAFSASRFSARRNSGEELIGFITDTDAVDGGDYVHLHDCLLVDNTVLADVIGAGGNVGPGAGTQLIVDTCTIAGNHYLPPTFFGNASVAAGVNFLEITNSIIYDAEAMQPLLFSGAPAADLTTRYVLTTDISAFVGGTGIVDLAPQFVDPANGDYHLMRTSPGVDFAPDVDGVDLDGNPRTIDLADIGNVFGAEDVGAYEIQTQQAPPDEIFQSGFDP
ncbi:MAG: hypothetical protein ABI843_02975 [Dokdonella sp.]